MSVDSPPDVQNSSITGFIADTLNPLLGGGGYICPGGGGGGCALQIFIVSEVCWYQLIEQGLKNYMVFFANRETPRCDR